jgi:hypothetical protein
VAERNSRSGFVTQGGGQQDDVSVVSDLFLKTSLIITVPI